MESPTVKVGSRVFTILFPTLLRPLTAPERSALKRSIRKSGVLSPVLVDENDGVVDGGNRVAIAAELGIKNIPTVRLNVTGMTDQEKAEIAEQANHARRHLKPADWKQMEEDRPERLAAVVELRRKGHSTRAIAEELGVSQPQIMRDIQTATDTGVSVEMPEKITGRDGRTVKATRTPREERIERVVEARAEGKSLRAIAEGLDVSQSFIPDDRPAQPRQEETLGLEDVHSEGLTRLLAAWRAADATERFAFDEMRAAGRAG